MEDTYITIPEFARKIGISRIAVFKRVKKGQIKALRIGRNWAIAASDADIFLKKALFPPVSSSEIKNKGEIINISSENVDKSVDKVDKSQNDENMESMGWD